MDRLDRLREAFANRYSIERVVGSGATATVYLARDHKLDRHVALKVLHPSLRADLGADRFEREIRIAANLSHPHILPLFDSGQAGPYLYFVMPFVEGQTLRQRLKREPQLPVEEATAIAAEVAEALAYAHDHGVVHRDIKPANLLFTGEHVLVCDFGVGRAITAAAGSTLTASGTVVGTPYYMSPEQTSAETPLDGRSDIYSLGCVLYEMLAGEPPFTGGTPQAIMARHLAGDVPPLSIVRPELPSRIVEIVERALAKSPADRFADAHELAEELRTWEASRGRSGRGVRRLEWLAAGAALAALAAIAFSTGIIRPPGSGGERPTAATPYPLNQIAVLPFADRSSSQRYEVLSGALTEELTTALSEVEGLFIEAPHATMAFPAGEVSPDSVARALEVGTLVYGSLDEVGSRYRLTVQLVESASGRLVSDPIRIGAPLDDPAGYDSLRIGVVETVARELRSRLGDHVRLTQWRRDSGAPEAWRLVEFGKDREELARQLELDGKLEAAHAVRLEADSVYGRAAALGEGWLEPAMLRGWVALDVARSLASLRLRGLADVAAVPGRPETPEGWYRFAVRLADGALRDGDPDPRALTRRAAARLRLWRFVGGPLTDSLVSASEADLRRAVEVNPLDARAWLHWADVLTELGRFDEASAAVSRAMKRDAYLTDAAAIISRQFFGLLEQGRFEEARASCEDGRARFGGDPNFRSCRLHHLGWSGSTPTDVASAWDELRVVEADGGGSLGLWGLRRALVAMVVARAGLRDSALRVVGRTRDSLPLLIQDREFAEMLQIDLNFYEAYVRVLIGQPTEAVALLEDLVGHDAGAREYIARTPFFRSLRDDPRFRRLVTAGGSGDAAEGNGR